MESGTRIESSPCRVLTRRVRAFALACGLLPMLPLLISAVPAMAQQQNQRTIEGTVTDKGGQPLKGATVYLKDEHTLAVRSYIAADGGAYRFGQLTQNTDYEIWAEDGGKSSGKKNISSFDSRPQINLTLKIDR